jgi:hypothetical protein
LSVFIIHQLAFAATAKDRADSSRLCPHYLAEP